MAKRKVKKAKKAVKKKKAVKARKIVRKVKAKVQAKLKVPKEKVLGRIEHYFDKISVAAISVKAPFKVGDVIHIKGHTTDFFQRVESMQIEHQSMTKVKKGDDVGIKVKEFVREHDPVYLASEKDLTAKPAAAQAPLFQTPLSQPASKPSPTPPPLLDPKKPEKAEPYSNMKFFNF